MLTNVSAVSVLGIEFGLEQKKHRLAWISVLFIAASYLLTFWIQGNALRTLTHRVQ